MQKKTKITILVACAVLIVLAGVILFVVHARNAKGVESSDTVSISNDEVGSGLQTQDSKSEDLIDLNEESDEDGLETVVSATQSNSKTNSGNSTSNNSSSGSNQAPSAPWKEEWPTGNDLELDINNEE